ncbi:MAG: preprotein translocase subunit SecA [bacterium]|nr:preprotein translocase subunit SecA [bacterium]
MINFFLRMIFGTKTERDIKALQPVIDKINSHEAVIRNLTDEQLAGCTHEFKKRLKEGESLDDLLPEAFSVVRETARRLLGERPFDVQLTGGIVLHKGKIAEMKTGEGKTLSSTLPAYLNALSGKGVHIVTVNDYLAKRDREWMGPIFEFLGLSVGVIQHDMALEHKQQAYNCDITYGTNNEFGFDYLRDNMIPHKNFKMQRELNYCIIDEVDSILIDEARTPLIISGPAEESTDKYYEVNRIIRALKKDEDFELEEKSKSAYLTEKGITHAESLMKIDNIFTTKNIEIQHLLSQSIRAHFLFKRDVDYMIKDGKVVIVDEFTGRIMPGRRWSDGLHQAIEAKENVIIEAENQTLATITFQNFFKLYKKISGMTGTAETEANEFMEIYKLDVVVIPTNMPMVRLDHQDQIYRTFKEKINAMVKEIEDRNKLGQPILVGTVSIEKSEIISRELKRRNILHQVLNAKYHEKEAQIIKQAGKKGTVTIATNMAGRGTDIVLGGYPDFKEELQENISVSSELTKSFHQYIVLGDLEQAGNLIEEFKGQEKDKALSVLCKLALKQHNFTVADGSIDRISLESLKKEIRGLSIRVKAWKEENEEVKNLGGLHIVGTERHEARRIDNQLRGRSGRQGDDGSSRFFICLEDDLMRIFGSDRISNVMQRLGLKEGEAIEHPWISKAIENAQKKVEDRNFEIRKHLLKYDNVMNVQRTFVYRKRNEILDEANLKEEIKDSLKEIIYNKTEQYCEAKNDPDHWDMENLNKFLFATFGMKTDGEAGNLKNLTRDEFNQMLYEKLLKIYEGKEVQITADLTRQIERAIMLQIIDTKWKEHLYAMDHLKEGISWRAYGERDPLVEYKFEGFRIFEELVGQIKQNSLEMLFKLDPEAIRQEMSRAMALEMSQARMGKEIHSEYGQFDALRAEAQETQNQGMMPQPQQQVRRSHEKIGRNDPCWCGSGKKFKHCHGNLDQ